MRASPDVQGRVDLSARDEHVRELMDDPACDPQRLRATLRRFETVNRLIAGWGTVYRTHVRPNLRTLGRPARVLDLGCGGGDLVVRLAARASRDGLEAEWIGVDPDDRAIAVARTRERLPETTFRQADAAQLVAAGERFDVVLSNHVLHHLGDDLHDFAAQSAALTRGIALHSDIARSRLAYGLYAVGIMPFAPGTFLRTDGLRSIRRSFTRGELQASLDRAAPGAWTVERPVPFRLLAVGVGRG